VASDKKSEEDAKLFEQAMSETNTSNRNYRQQRFNSYNHRSKPDKAITPGRYVSTDQAEPAVIDQTTQGESVLYCRAGLQRNVIRRLKRGEYPCQAVLDLHGMRTHHADEALEIFLSEAIQHELSCVLIIHGKGYHSENRQGVLKPYTIDWLKKPAQVKAFCSALTRDGGTGAVYVLLKQGTPRIR